MPSFVPCLALFFEEDFIADVPLNKTTYVIGRKSTCQLRLMDTSVSREHARITLSDAGILTIEDLQSTNGSLINGERLVTRALKPKDTLALGRFTLIFHEVEKENFPGTKEPFLKRWMATSSNIKFVQPRGTYVLPDDDAVTEFDAVAYSMVRHQEKVDETPTRAHFVKRITYLQMAARKDEPIANEVTKFFVPQNVFKDTKELFSASENTLPVFGQPEVKTKIFKLPWKTLEKILAPFLLVIVIIFVGRYMLSFHIDSELKQAEKHWDDRLTVVAEKFRFADDSTFASLDPRHTPVTDKTRARPLSVTEVWKRIDAAPALRNFLLFEILDEVLSSKDLTWTLDQTLRNLSNLKSVTSRLPSVKQFQVVLTAAAAPFDLTGIRESRLIFLANEKTEVGSTQAYSDYKETLTPRLSAVNGCAASRKVITPGKVVLAFTISDAGKASSIYVNEAHSSKEVALWDCVKSKLSSLQFDAPPRGSISIVYTFVFAGPSKIEF